MKKIVFVLHCLNKMGGTEKATVNLANTLAEDSNYEVFILSIYKHSWESPIKYNLNPKIKVIYLMEKVVYLKYNIILYRLFEILLKSVVNRSLKLIKPDIVIYTSIKFMSFQKTTYKKLLHIHTSFKAYKKGKFSYHKLKKNIKKIDGVILLSKTCLEEFEKEFKQQNGIFIPNITNVEIKKRTNQKNNKIIFLGRLDNEIKQIDHLISVFSNIVTKQKLYNWQLHIYGSGNDESMLRKIVTDKNLNEYIKFKGVASDLDSIFTKYDIMCLTSAYEGLPMSLIEAGCSGLALISYDSSPGIKDIIKDGQNGYIVTLNDQKEFESKLYKLMIDDEERRNMGEASLQIMKNNFHKTIIKKKWDYLLNSYERGWE